VLLFWIAFVGAPALCRRLELAHRRRCSRRSDSAPLLVRDVSLLWRAIIALTIAYSAFIAEMFRAGIQAVDKGQIEAARRSAVRLAALPPDRLAAGVPHHPAALLGNDFIAMVKDSSLVSVLGVADITQMGKIYAAGSFRFFETYSIVAYIYLS
jgi:polar amino acid transport system permease protein